MWYDNIPKQGVLCKVRIDGREVRYEYHVILSVSINLKGEPYSFRSYQFSFDNAVPATMDELTNLYLAP